MTSSASCRREVKVGGWVGRHWHPCLGCLVGTHSMAHSGSEPLWDAISTATQVLR